MSGRAVLTFWSVLVGLLFIVYISTFATYQYIAFQSDKNLEGKRKACSRSGVALSHGAQCKFHVTDIFFFRRASVPHDR